MPASAHLMLFNDLATIGYTCTFIFLISLGRLHYAMWPDIHKWIFKNRFASDLELKINCSDDKKKSSRWRLSGTSNFSGCLGNFFFCIYEKLAGAWHKTIQRFSELHVTCDVWLCWQSLRRTCVEKYFYYSRIHIIYRFFKFYKGFPY